MKDFLLNPNFYVPIVVGYGVVALFLLYLICSKIIPEVRDDLVIATWKIVLITAACTLLWPLGVVASFAVELYCGIARRLRRGRK